MFGGQRLVPCGSCMSVIAIVWFVFVDRFVYSGRLFASRPLS